MNYGQATPLLEDMISLVERYKNDPDAPPSAKIYFGHAETVVPLIALLGLFEGPALTAEGFLLSKHRKDNHDHQFTSLITDKPNQIICDYLIRSFRTSAIAPYSSNIAFLVYRKLESNSDSDMPKMLLQISVNEHLVNIPGMIHGPHAFN